MFGKNWQNFEKGNLGPKIGVGLREFELKEMGTPFKLYYRNYLTTCIPGGSLFKPLRHPEDALFHLL
jgi:hypothetical protein